MNMVLSSSQYRNNGLIQSGPQRQAGRGTVRQLHAICSEVESNPIRLLRLMPGQKVKSGTANIRSRVSRALGRFSQPFSFAQSPRPRHHASASIGRRRTGSISQAHRAAPAERFFYWIGPLVEWNFSGAHLAIA